MKKSDARVASDDPLICAPQPSGATPVLNATPKTGGEPPEDPPSRLTRRQLRIPKSRKTEKCSSSPACKGVCIEGSGARGWQGSRGTPWPRRTTLPCGPDTSRAALPRRHPAIPLHPGSDWARNRYSESSWSPDVVTLTRGSACPAGAWVRERCRILPCFPTYSYLSYLFGGDCVGGAFRAYAYVRVGGWVAPWGGVGHYIGRNYWLTVVDTLGRVVTVTTTDRLEPSCPTVRRPSSLRSSSRSSQYPRPWR